ncbi:MAG: hypothetical protein LW875_02280 [Proteobacteria bacterium]|nr:hypothetical protein [Pseudomonadota bacterium]
MSTQWIPITEYSLKHKVSISTLRRRIKSNEIKFIFDDGKYLIADEPIPLLTPIGLHRPSLKTMSGPSLEKDQLSEEPILTAANRLLSELKKAYTQILQEKEEQILQLKGEVADLKTLVKVLESDNLRLRDSQKESRAGRPHFTEVNHLKF